MGAAGAAGTGAGAGAEAGAGATVFGGFAIPLAVFWLTAAGGATCLVVLEAAHRGARSGKTM